MKTTTFLSICLITSIILTGCGAGTPVNTATPAYTPTPPNTTTADLTNVFLKPEDLPAGFHRFTNDEIKTLGIDLTSVLSRYGGGTNLVKTDIYGKNPQTEEFLFEGLFYPCSSDFIVATDKVFSNPEAFYPSNVKGISLLPNLSGIGNGSMGITSIDQGTTSNILTFRRNNTLIALIEINKSATSNFDLRATGQKMDQYVLAEYK